MKHLPILLIIFLFLLSGCAAFTPETKAPTTSEASTLPQIDTAANPKAYYHYMAGETKLSEGNLNGAVLEMETALRYDNSAYLITKLASLYTRTGDIKLAIERLRS